MRYESLAHMTIMSNLARWLRSSEGRCFVFLSNLRVMTSETEFCAYPDVVIARDAPRFGGERRDALLNPQVLFEVLSPATEADDRGEKFAHYRQIRSLTEYLLVAQDEPRIEQYVRQSSGDWLWHEAAGMNDSIRLPSIECELRLADVYDRVEFPDSESCNTDNQE